MGFLTDLTGDIRRRLERAPLDDGRLMARAMAMPPTRPFDAAIAGADGVAVIAEVKRSSPSAGAIAADADPGAQGAAYVAGGAAAISVLTEPTRFDGSIADLRSVRYAVEVPVLRKDFLVHPAQVIESRAEGADAVLLITAALEPTELKAMVAAASDLGLGTLVETHSEEDLEVALATEATVIGVHARDLESLDVDVERALRLLRRVPDDRIAVFESGIRTRDDVERAVEAGARAVLVGERLMRASDPARTLRQLRGVAWA
jgi:indole-3-glycerol phosphate synthase